MVSVVPRVYSEKKKRQMKTFSLSPAITSSKPQFEDFHLTDSSSMSPGNWNPDSAESNSTQPSFSPAQIASLRFVFLINQDLIALILDFQRLLHCLGSQMS